MQNSENKRRKEWFRSDHRCHAQKCIRPGRGHLVVIFSNLTHNTQNNLLTNCLPIVRHRFGVRNYYVHVMTFGIELKIWIKTSKIFLKRIRFIFPSISCNWLNFAVRISVPFALMYKLETNCYLNVHCNINWK